RVGRYDMLEKLYCFVRVLCLSGRRGRIKQLFVSVASACISVANRDHTRLLRLSEALVPIDRHVMTFAAHRGEHDLSDLSAADADLEFVAVARASDTIIKSFIICLGASDLSAVDH